MYHTFTFICIFVVIKTTLSYTNFQHSKMQLGLFYEKSLVVRLNDILMSPTLLIIVHAFEHSLEKCIYNFRKNDLYV